MTNKAERKRTWRKCAAVILAFAMLCTSILPGATADAAAKKVPAKSVTFATKEKTNVLLIGKTYRLTYTLSPKSSTDKVTYRSSNKKIATVGLTKGKITPRKAGEVTITATTSSGKKKAIKFLVMDKNGTTIYQSRVNKMLKADNVKKITIQNKKKSADYVIAKGDYSDKTLVVNAPKSDVSNSGVFKEVSIKAIKDNTWTEKAIGNILKIFDNSVRVVVDKKAVIQAINVLAKGANFNLDAAGTVKQMNVSAKDATIDVNVSAGGNLKEIVLDNKADVTISGSTEKMMIEVSKKAEGSSITSSVPIEISVNSKVEVTLNKGAEGSKVTKSNSNVNVVVKNETEDQVVIGTKGSDVTETVNSGDTSTDANNKEENNNENNNGGGSVVLPTTATVKGISSDGGKTATFVLPISIDGLRSARVIVNALNDRSYYIDGQVLTYVKKLLASEDKYVDLWMNTSSFESSVAAGGHKVSFNGVGAEKTVAFDDMTFTVNVRKATKDITVKKAGSNITYTLSKSGRDTLIIKSDLNDKVADMVTFEVTY